MAAIARWRVRCGLAWALGLSMLGMPVDTAAQSPRPGEYQVKAAYLFNFGKFAEWPPSALPAGGEHFIICVLGIDPFGRALDTTVAQARVQARAVSVKRIAQPEDGAQCHILFISSSEDARLPFVLRVLSKMPVLTVGETRGFADRGGMVEFRTEGSRVRFAVNLGAAQETGLVLSSELLRVATAVLKTPQPGN